MTDFSNCYTSFLGHRRLASGSVQDVALAVKRTLEAGSAETILVIDDSTGRPIDLDTTGSDADVIARLLAPTQAGARPPRSAHARMFQLGAADGSPADSDAANGDVVAPRGRGRPKLGVVAREVTLLPRHWEWLATQPDGASVALRRLVEVARRDAHTDRLRQAQERAYHYMSAMAGDLPGFEEATRALFANDQTSFHQRIGGWPPDVAHHASLLAFGKPPHLPEPPPRNLSP